MKKFFIALFALSVCFNNHSFLSLFKSKTTKQFEKNQKSVITEAIKAQLPELTTTIRKKAEEFLGENPQPGEVDLLVNAVKSRLTSKKSPLRKEIKNEIKEFLESHPKIGRDKLVVMEDLSTNHIYDKTRDLKGAIETYVKNSISKVNSEKNDFYDKTFTSKQKEIDLDRDHLDLSQPINNTPQKTAAEEFLDLEKVENAQTAERANMTDSIKNIENKEAVDVKLADKGTVIDTIKTGIKKVGKSIKDALKKLTKSKKQKNDEQTEALIEAQKQELEEKEKNNDDHNDSGNSTDDNNYDEMPDGM